MKKSRDTKKLVCLFLYMSLLGSGLCQTNPLSEVSIASPTAASLGKYADYPVSYHTGTPQISIPIYTVKAGSLELPISLSYHASGLKVQELASWVGAGWSLNAGGVITRSVIGLPDDKGFPVGNNQTTNGHWTDYGYNNYLATMTGGSTPDDRGFSEGRKDGEPDLYFFNFGGYTGKFYFRDDRTPVLVPEQDFKIIPDSGYISTGSSSGACFRGFTIITPDGNKYTFGSTNNSGSVVPVEVTSPFTLDNGLSNGAAVSSWYLNKVVSKDSMFTINLNYTQENYSYYTLSMFPLNSTNLIGQYEYKPVKQFIQGVRLSSITTLSGQVIFNTSTSTRSDLSAYTPQTMYDATNTDAKSLGSIQITNNNGFCKQYNFSYGYFHDGVNGLNGQLSNWLSLYNITSDANRLRLDSIQEVSCDNSITVPPYRFSYYSEMVPRLLSFGIDHWGYYNGLTNNSTLIPTYTVNGTTTVNGANRDPSWPAMRGGTLQQITYPTGGYTLFNFQSHDTYKTFTSIQNTARASAAVLYDGSTSDQVSFTTSSTSNAFSLTTSSTTAGRTGSLQITGPGGTVGTYSIAGSSYNNYTLSLSPNTTYTLSLTGSSTTSNWGGVSATVYELVPTQGSSNMTVGGLRIQSITNHDGLAGQDIVTNYSYLSGSQSTGILYSLPTYVSVLRNDLFGQVWSNCGTMGASVSYGCATITGGGSGFQAAFLVSPSAVKPMNTTQGNHIGYNAVTVTQSGNGSSQYQYYGSNTWDGLQSYPDVAVRNVNTTTCDPSVPSYPFAPLPFDFMTGELKYESHSNQSGQLLKEAYYYPVYTQDPIGTPGYIVKNLYITLANNGGPLFGTEYMLYSSSKTQDKKIETIYDPASGNHVTTANTTYYGSSFHHQPTQKILVNSTGDNLITNTKYAFDYRIAACDAISDGNSTYLSSMSTALTRYDSAMISCNSGTYTCDIDNCRWVNSGQYRINKANARINFINWRQQNFANANSIFNSSLTSAKASADTELKPILALQDEYDNAVIETSSWKNSNLLSAAFNRYDYVSNPSGFVYPQQTQSINLASPSSSFTKSATSSSGTSLTKDSRYIDETVFNFNAGNLVSVTKKDGVTNTYLWGYNNLYPVAKIHGTDYTTASGLVNSSVLQNPSSDAVLRTQLSNLNSNLTSAFVTAYTYMPMLGITSETDPAGHTSYYEYDAFGRLRIIRDQYRNILKKYCYNYAGQPENCTIYFNSAKSQNFAVNNCTAGGNASTVTYSVPTGTYTSTISQTDADSKAQNDVNTNGQTYANTHGICTYTSAVKSGTYQKNNCASGGVGSSVTYTVAAGAYTSTISQSDADSKAQSDVNTNGQTYANNNGVCTFISAVKSGTYQKNNCASGGVGSSVTYTVAAAAYTSTISQADADSKTQNDVNTNGQTYANNNGVCTFSSAVKSGTYQKNNCAAGGVGSSVTYTVAAGGYTSTISQADADSKAQTDVNNNGQTYANNNGYCTFSSAVKSGTYQKNNCATGGTGSTVTYTVAAGAYTSTSSQADADGKAQADVWTNGQTYANNNGYCTFYNITKTGSYQKNNCATGGTGSWTTYYVGSGIYSSIISQADADSKAQNDVNNNGQTYANNNGYCTFYSNSKSGTYQKNNCASGGTGSYVTYTVNAGAYSSTTSQADADSKAQTDVNNNGQNYANNNGYCTFYSNSKSGTYQKNNCASGGTGSYVTYTVNAGAYSSTISQSDADSKAQNDVNSNGQSYTNNNGYCTFYNTIKAGSYQKNNCAAGGTGSWITYYVNAGAYSSTTSQADADSKAQTDVNNNGQTYANNNCYCTFYSNSKSGSFQKNNCASGGTGSYVTYTVNAGAYSSTISQSDADSKAQAEVNEYGQNYANNNGYCTFYSAGLNSLFSRNNCASGGTSSWVWYSISAGAFSSTISQADADNQAMNSWMVNGQNYANANCSCTFYNATISQNFTKNNCPSGWTPSTVTYTVNAGAYSSTISQSDADSKAQAEVNEYGQNYANNNGYCTFYSAGLNSLFSRNNCASGGTSSWVWYSISAGAFSSTISQADADNQAMNSWMVNGQNYANANCSCTFYNATISQNFTKNNCPSGWTPSTVTYTVNAGAYSSTVIQSDANNQAQNDVNANGQNYANANGTCTSSCNSSNCSGEGVACINGNCEYGVQVYTSSDYDINQGVYWCTYHYEFSDGSWSGDYSRWHDTDCLGG